MRAEGVFDAAELLHASEPAQPSSSVYSTVIAPAG